MQKSTTLLILAELNPVRRDLDKFAVLVLSTHSYYVLLAHLMQIVESPTVEDRVFALRKLAVNTQKKCRISILDSEITATIGLKEWVIQEIDTAESFVALYDTIVRYLTE